MLGSSGCLYIFESGHGCFCCGCCCWQELLKQVVRSLGRFDVYFVCFIISDLNRSDTPENAALHASVEREQADTTERKVS